MAQKAQTKTEANKIKKALLAKNPNSNIGIYKFATKRKYQFFIGTWFEWLAKIS